MHGKSAKALALFLVLSLVIVSGCTGRSPEIPRDVVPEKHSSYDLPISSRGFYMGVVPTPKNSPDTTWDDLVNAYEETGRIGEVGMVWVQPSGIGQQAALEKNKVTTALQTYGLEPVLTLSFATIKEVPGVGLEYAIDAPAHVNADLSDLEFRDMWVSEARKIAREFSPPYFSLGNEINDYFYLNPDQLEDYLSLFDDAYAAIKEASPDTKVFVVFSYTHLIDNGQWDMLEEFDERADLIGLTTYPWKHYGDPSDIPEDYYTRLEQHVSKPVAFTETGWPSSASQGSSEEEQARFLVRFLQLTKGMDLEMVNWLFLHEVKLEGIISKVTAPETGTISLKRADGTEKEIYGVWLDLNGMGYSGQG